MPADKITSKNLSYDQTLPPFLARLRGQQTSDPQSPDPILAARRRPGRVRTASEEAEDAPLVVDEDGNVVQLEAGQQLGADGQVEGGAAPDGNLEENTDEAAELPEKEKERFAGIGASRKRKVGKVIGGDDNEGDRAKDVDDAIAKAVKATKKLTNEPARKEEPRISTNKPNEKIGKKKAKKIKLSFGDDEG